jgi:Na+/H+-dicarboxylate symporter
MQLYTKILIAMATGIVLGLLVGPNAMTLQADTIVLSTSTVVMTEKAGETTTPLAKHTHTASLTGPATDGWLPITWQLSASDSLKLNKDKNNAKDPESFASAETLRAGQILTGWVEEKNVHPVSSIGLLLVGATEWIGLLFLALIKMVVVPLVFFSLVVGVATLGDLRDLGRLGSRTIGYFFLTTIGALTIGLGLGNLFPPSALLTAEDRTRLTLSYADIATAKAGNAAEAPSLMENLLAMVPQNPVASLANGDMLQIIVFAVLLGIALTMMKPDRSKLIIDVFDRLNEAMIYLVHIAMALAPYGVGALLFKVAGTTGLSVLLSLAGYSTLVLVGLVLHVILIYCAVLFFGARLHPLHFISGMKEAFLVAFSTSSSSATLPVTMECCEQNLNTSPKIASFVLPLGATINMDGTALYQAIATLFIAGVYIPDGLTFVDQLTIVFTATLASVGAAGVPGAGIVTLAMVLTAINVPLEGIALILGVDRLLDMFRTVTNVFGDATATCLMARLEGDELKLLTDVEDAANPDKGFEGRLG